MVICNKSRLSIVEDFEIKVNNYVISSVECQNVLGSIVHKTLSWSFHVKRICSNLHLKLHLFAKKACFLNLDTNPTVLKLGSQMAEPHSFLTFTGTMALLGKNLPL